MYLADKQKSLYEKQEVHEIFPEYWLIKGSKFNNAVQDMLESEKWRSPRKLYR